MANSPTPIIAKVLEYVLYVPATINMILLIINSNRANNKTIPKRLSICIPNANRAIANTMSDTKIPITEKMTAFIICKPYNFSQKFNKSPI